MRLQKAMFLVNSRGAGLPSSLLRGNILSGDKGWFINVKQLGWGILIFTEYFILRDLVGVFISSEIFGLG